MGFRSGLASTLTRVAKTVGPAAPIPEQTLPQQMTQAAEDRSLMGPENPFAPGLPIAPYDGYSRTPRTHNYTTAYNVATRPRTHERVSFWTLRGLIESYDVASICIWHRIDSVRSLKWKLIAADNYTGDVTAAVPLAMSVLKSPDRKHSFKTWLAKYLYDILAYDAGTLYRMRNRAGRCTGLKPIDGTTIAPLLDYWGDSPEPPAEAFVQYANGIPWNWLTRDDLIYEPFRPHTDSPYGHAPIESIILNANTDIRFQIYFLERFTAGNIPEAFASAPETWTPEQVEQWQAYWDGLIYGDQAAKHQVKWLPGGSTFAWSNEKDFTDGFSLFLMRKTCSAFHVTPADMGFTENVNRSSGESQADVQHRVGDLPLMEHVEGILSQFLYDDLGLPLQFEFDRGEEQDDQLAVAQSDDIYIKNGTVGTSEIREMRFGLHEPQGRTVPRFIFTERGGPIPLNSLFAVAGQIDQQTAAPAPGAQLPHTAFGGVRGVEAEPPPKVPPLAVEEYGPSAMPADQQPAAAPAAPGPVAKEAAAAAPAAAPGITTGTGITSVDLDGRHDDDDEQAEDQAAVAKAELTAFRSFRRKRRQAGEWRDFEFRALDPVTGHRLNDAGRLAVAKATGQVAVAGLAVQAADTGRVLMLQRALTEDDPAGGMWEFPSGHIEADETALTAAAREWCEETGCILPIEPGAMAALAFGNGRTWLAGGGIYAGFVYPVASEASIPVRSTAQVTNPDDPDGDGVEAIAWWNPADLPGNPAVRAELLASLDVVLPLLTPAPCCGAPCCADGCCGGPAGCQCGTEPVAKAAAPGLTSRSGMISLDLPDGLIQPPPGGVDDHHITVVYLGPDVDDQAFAQACERAQAAAAAMPGPVTGSLAGVDSFRPSAGSGGKIPAYVPATLPGATPLRAALEDLSASEHTTWKPHVTLAYLGEGDPMPEPLPSTPVTFTHLSVHRGSDVQRFRFGGGQPVAKAGGTGPDSEAWPGWDRDQELGDLYAGRIRQALTSAVDVRALAAAWLELHPPVHGSPAPGLGADTVAKAINPAVAGFLAAVAQAIRAAFGPLLRNLWTEGWVLGQVSAQAVLASEPADWRGWTPGDYAAAAQVAGGGLQRLLADANITIQSITQDRIGELASVLEAALRSDVTEIEPYHKPPGVWSMQADLPARNSIGDLAAKLERVLDNPAYAKMVAHTEMARAQSAATLAAYTETGVTFKRWLSAEDARVCPFCGGNAAAGPVPMGAPFPSGSEAPPAHPFCRCALMPTEAPGEPTVPVAKVGPHGYIHGWIYVGAPVAGDRVSHPHHGEGTVTRAANGSVHVQFDSGHKHEFAVREDQGPGHFEKLSEHELIGEMDRGPGQRFDHALAELQRRDTAARENHVRDLYQQHPKSKEDRDHLYGQLLDAGENPEDAYSHAYGKDTEDMRRKAAIAQLRAQGYRGSSFDALSLNAFWHDSQQRAIEAETATNGVMLNAHGVRAGIDPWSLFTSNEQTARKYASEELLNHWDQVGRPTLADFQGQLLGHGPAGGPRGGDFRK